MILLYMGHGMASTIQFRELHYEHLEVQPGIGMIKRRTDGDRHKVAEF